MPCAAFSDVVKSRRAWPTGPPVPPTPIDPRDLLRHITCPSCRGAMDVHPYYGPGNVVIDTCGQCYLVWLDHGELKEIADAPGQDRGRTNPTAPRVSLPSGPLAATRDDTRPTLMDVLDELFGWG